MDENKNRGFAGMIKNGLSYITRRVVADISAPIKEGAEIAVQKIEDGVIRVEERILRKVFSFTAIWFGAVFLMFSLFFYMREFLGWNNSAAYFSICIILFFTGLVLNAKDRISGKNGRRNRI